ncbi:MAG: 3-phosphoserine/phosphohydroxythreonine transaminase [Clostridia bacterium]|nr:3-phosphoserine/phosphohydroxythreonine transaminase [Clostridia bacterium]
MNNVYNFAAGPAQLPEAVLRRAQDELSDNRRRGISVLEMSHDSREFSTVIKSAEASLRELMNIPQNYKVLFLQGGATTQFAAIPLNLLSERRTADYVITGQSSRNAYLQAKKYGDIAIAASSAGASPAFSTVPETTRADFRPDADYVHICYNNTVYGTKFNYVPDTGNIPLVANMSSSILSEPVDVTKFALIYASAQKNIAPAGMTVVIVRDDLIGNARPETPFMLDYKLHADSRSMYNTPPVYQIYMAKLMFDWILSVGGLDEMKRRNERKASLLYDYLDSQHYYTAPVDKKCRSMTNVIFITGDAKLDTKFAKEADRAGLKNLKGHSSVGGMRASLYNSMTEQGVAALVDFMKHFAEDNPKLGA